MKTPVPANAASPEIPVGRDRLTGKIVLVFGAGSAGEGWGNGKATSVAYAREGATIIAVDRDRAAADATASIIGELGGRVSSYAADVTDSAAVERSSTRSWPGTGASTCSTTTSARRSWAARWRCPRRTGIRCSTST